MLAGGASAGARLLGDARVDRIVFQCTGVTMFSPEMGAKIRAEIEELTGIPMIVTSEAIIVAFNALRAHRIALLTPYVESVHEQREKAFLKANSIELVLDHALGLNTNNIAAEVEALFLSCTALRSAGIIAKLEAELGRPVITSDQAAVWYVLASAGVEREPTAFRRLFACKLP